MDKSDIDRKVDELDVWRKTQPELPHKMEKFAIKIFLLSKNGDVEATKILIHDHFKFRLKHEHIFLDRDPFDEATKQQLEIENLLKLPGRTSTNDQLYLNKLIDCDPAKYNFDEVIKTFFLMCDLFSLDDMDYDGEVVIFDMAGMTWRHNLKLSLSTARIFFKAVQESYPLRLKEIHIINATSFLDTMVRWAKPLMRSDLFNKIQIHLPNAETPYDYFPRDMLPEEYGGKAGKLSEIRTYWLDKLMEHRNYLVEEGRWRYNTV